MRERLSERRIERSVDSAAARISAPIEEKETRLCLELCQSKQWKRGTPPAGSSNPERKPV